MQGKADEDEVDVQMMGLLDLWLFKQKSFIFPNTFSACSLLKATAFLLTIFLVREENKLIAPINCIMFFAISIPQGKPLC